MAMGRRLKKRSFTQKSALYLNNHSTANSLYGIVVYGRAFSKITNLKIKMQRTAELSVSCALTTTPTNTFYLWT